MYYTMKQDNFFDTLPLYLSNYDSDKISISLESKNQKDLEEDVRLEEKYLEYLFNYAKGINH